MWQRLISWAFRELFEETEAELAAAAAAPKKGGKSAFKLNSVGAQFRKQLQGLMATLNLCQPHYIRCARNQHQATMQKTGYNHDVA